MQDNSSFMNNSAIDRLAADVPVHNSLFDLLALIKQLATYINSEFHDNWTLALGSGWMNSVYAVTLLSVTKFKSDEAVVDGLVRDDEDTADEMQRE